MAILQQCPICRRKYKIAKKRCHCGHDLDQAKRSGRVTYWISYRLPGGKQKRESVDRFEDLDGQSLEDAKIALSKRDVQKREGRLLDIKPEYKTTFKQLSQWYLDLESVKALSSYSTVKTYLNKFVQVFGDRIVADIKLTDLEDLQVKRKKQGLKPKTIDDELNYTKGMIIKAFYLDKVDGDTLKAFQRVNHCSGKEQTEGKGY